MKIIGLTGPAGSGKDTACSMALEWCDENDIAAERLAFADPLKCSAAAALGRPGSSAAEAIAFCNMLKQPGVDICMSAPNHSELGPSRFTSTLITGREFLQLYGTEAHRDVFGQDFWVEVTERKLAERSWTDLDVVFLTDPRFANEAGMIYEHGGELWHIARPDLDSVNDHSSEAGLPWTEFDSGLNNDGTLAGLHDKVYSLCETRLKGVS